MYVLVRASSRVSAVDWVFWGSEGRFFIFDPTVFFLVGCDFSFSRMADLSLFAKMAHMAHTWMSLDFQSMVDFHSSEGHSQLI